MRLIDADALMREFAEFVAPSNRSDFEPTPTWNDAVSLLGSAPTVADVAPIVRGEWIHAVDEYGDSYICSNCKMEFEVLPDTIEEFLDYSHYCPNCGAKMDGGERNG